MREGVRVTTFAVKPGFWKWAAVCLVAVAIGKVGPQLAPGHGLSIMFIAAAVSLFAAIKMSRRLL